MKENSKEYIKQQLSTNKGYLTKTGVLKKGYKYLADKFGCSQILIKEIVFEIRQSNKEEFNNEVAKFIEKSRTVATKIVNYNKIKKQSDINSGTYWITGCAHAPWHNKKMYESTFNYLSKEVDLEGIILAGDIADLASLSSHDRGKTPIPGVTLSWEYDKVNKFLDEIDSIKSNINYKAYLYGNHEDRYLRAIKDVDIAKYGKSLISPIEGLKLDSRGYDVKTDWKNDCISLGRHLDINHGEFLNVHSAKKTIDTYRKSIMYFHTHRFQIYLEGNVGGWNMGSGADFNAPIFGYATRAMKNSWVNSSALATLDKDGYYHIEPLLFINNKLIINGKEY